LVDGFEAPATGVALGPAVLQLQEAHHQRDLVASVDQKLRRDTIILADSGVGCAGRAQNTPLPT
jgi:hypothetical protein